MKVGYIRISKRTWYYKGGFTNSHLFRKAHKNGSWGYYELY
jgi:hypothetical protein